MKKGIVMAVIIAGAILLAAAAMIYFSPFQTCVRATLRQLDYDDPALELQTAQQSCAGVRF